MSLDNLFLEETDQINFIGKDGFFWWVGEVEDNEDPMELGRVKVRVVGYYTNFRGGTVADLPSENLPWATVLQHTSQAGNDGQGESSGQLQPGAIVMGFFMDGEVAQMPVVIGVMRVKKSSESRTERDFSFTDQKIEAGVAPNTSAIHPAEKNTISPIQPLRQGESNIVAFPGQSTTQLGGSGSPKNIGSHKGLVGSSANPIKPLDPAKPIPAANGVGGPWKTLEYKLSYLIEDLANTSSNLVKAEGGDYLDLVSGKLITKADLTVRIENYLGSLFAQVISAMRQSLINLTEDLKLANILLQSTGEPYAVLSTVQIAITKILSTLCTQDAQISTYTATPLKTVTDVLDTYLTGVIDKPTMVTRSVNTITNDIVKDVAKIVKDIGDLTKSINTTVSGIGEATKIIDAWEKSTGIFHLQDAVSYDVVNISGMIELIAAFDVNACKRTPNASKAMGWYPLLGLSNTLKTNDIFSTIFDDADPYLTTAKNNVSGSYEVQLGTPGRQGEVIKKPNGTTHTSFLYNNSHYAEKKARDSFRISNPNATEAEVNAAVEDYRKNQTNNKGDTGSIVADHISWAGVLTQEVHGDDCKLVSGDYARTIDGDYYLKVTGNCHLEVGGGFFLSAEGYDKDTKSTQKHTLKFGSDVDMNVVGAAYEVHSSEYRIKSTSTKITGSLYENSYQQQTRSGAELTFNAESSVEIATPHLLQLINTEKQASVKTVTGMRTVVNGGYQTIINPSNIKDYYISLTNEKSAYKSIIPDKYEISGTYTYDALGSSGSVT
jgi:hypothetical protein|tara:strand:- start:5742 stop:8069 length:2328 start_codon:yes stop_codon:yes gene_type:complete